jgi:8-amino-7-oxononanoate synthase
MDGDMAPLLKISDICSRYGAHLIVDEAHATGVIGQNGEGLVQMLGLQAKCFARMHTFGKACGVHGAIILGSEHLRDYLINFSRAFIYTTALPEITTAAILESYQVFPRLLNERQHLQKLVRQFQLADFGFEMLKSDTPIQGVLVPGNDEVKRIASLLKETNLDVRPILYPTVPKGGERLRIVLHAFNTEEEVAQLVHCLQQKGPA